MFYTQVQTVKNNIKEFYLFFLSKIMLATSQVIVKLPYGLEVKTRFLEDVWNEKVLVKVGTHELVFHCPTKVPTYRARTLMTKEPETIAWLSEIPQLSVLWDVGANVGMYSVFAAKVRGISVFAFEPSMRNLDLLQRNIKSNKCVGEIVVIPVALGQETQVTKLYMDSNFLTWGGAHNSATKAIRQDGKRMQSYVELQQLIGSGDSLQSTFNLPFPNYLKIDVDGLEPEILIGMSKCLKSVKSVLIECDSNNSASKKRIEEILIEAGFVKRTFIDGYTENTIWDYEQARRVVN